MSNFINKILSILLLVVSSSVFAAPSCGDCSNPTPECLKMCFAKNNQFQSSTEQIPVNPTKDANENTGEIQLGSVPPPTPTAGYGSPSLFDKLKSSPAQRSDTIPLATPERDQQASTTQQPASIFH